MWWYEKRNTKFKILNISSKILVYLQKNVMLLFEVKKQCRKQKSKRYKNKKMTTNAFIKFAVYESKKLKYI